jgi:hypothetical protein
MYKKNQTKILQDIIRIEPPQPLRPVVAVEGGAGKRRHLVLITALIAVACVVSGLLFFRAPKSGAAVAKFFPAQCLGNLAQPQLAQGKPDVEADGSPSAFTDENSAVFQNGAKQIYCGSFQGDIEPDARIVAVRLRLSVTTGNKTEQASSSIALAISDLLSSSSVPILSEGKPAQNEMTNTASDSVFVIADGGTQTAEEIASGSLPLQDMDVVASGSVTFSADEMLQGGVPLVAGSAADIAANVFEVKYSLDNNSWQSLGRVSRIDVRNSFTIPITSFEEIGRLQIAVESLPNDDATFFAYLDGMEIESEYVKDTMVKQAIQKTASDLQPAFDYASFSVVRTIADNTSDVLLLEDSQKRRELWIKEKGDEAGVSAKKIADQESMLIDSPLGVQDGAVFWISPDQNALEGFDVVGKIRFSQTIERSATGFPITIGDRAYTVAADGDLLIFTPIPESVPGDVTEEDL